MTDAQGNMDGLAPIPPLDTRQNTAGSAKKEIDELGACRFLGRGLNA